MKTRTITQVKIYKLHLNPMRASAEDTNIVAISYDEDKLIDWYEGLKVEEYKDEGWSKSFRRGSALEWYNPIDSWSGISEDWVEEGSVESYIKVAKESYGTMAVPELIE